MVGLRISREADPAGESIRRRSAFDPSARGSRRARGIPHMLEPSLDTVELRFRTEEEPGQLAERIRSWSG